MKALVAHDPRRSSTSGTWNEEPVEVALARSPAFGRAFFEAVFARHPQLASAATFLRWSTQAGDSYAVFAWDAQSFGVQIDPDCEYVIVWGADGSAEHGDWHGTRLSEALAHVSRLVEGAPGG